MARRGLQTTVRARPSESNYARKKRLQMEWRSSEEPSGPMPEESHTVSFDRVDRLAPGRIRGRMKFFDHNKGFGFITCDGGEDVYVHARGFRDSSDSVGDSDRVEFSIVNGLKGPKAAGVEILG